jgi:glycosyltransferase involved in cell wall biosynthesis
MRLLFVARAMNEMAGGVERMIVTIMNEMVLRGHEVALFSWDRGDAVSFYRMNDAVHWFKLQSGNPAAKAGLLTRLKRLTRVRGIVSEFKPDTIVCFQGGPYRAMLGYTFGLGIPLVAAERTAPTLYDHTQKSGTKRIEHISFRFAKRITVQFDRYRQYYPPYLHKLITETPNPVPASSMTAKPAQSGEDGRFRLLSVGRLSYQKNYEVLLEAFSLIAEQFPNWDLHIVGEGENRNSLQKTIDSRTQLLGRVFMPGKTSAVDQAYAGANLFCLPSRWEGFPNALAEALAHGLPAVGFEGCAGIPDLIEVGESGVLATGNGTASSLAAALATLMADDLLRGKMGAQAQLSMKRYAPSKCFDRWEAILAEAASK